VISRAKVSELTELNPNHIGAMVRLHDLVKSEHTHPVLAKAADSIASVLIRRSGTVGGNICLDTRCYWFNQTEQWRESIDWCYKCDCGTGADCRVIPNQNTLCVATYQADLAPVLMCLGATIHLASPDGKRSMPLSEFFQLDGMTRNVLQPGELVTHLSLPDDSGEWQGDYQKLRQRESWDFPEAGVAVLWKRNGGAKPAALRVATTGLESIPGFHTEEAESALADWNGKESVNAMAEAIRKAVKPVQNTWYSPSYRRKMVKVLTRRACAGMLR
jgi:4-hydroxybenzoyl-CoA reductase subunit beta